MKENIFKGFERRGCRAVHTETANGFHYGEVVFPDKRNNDLVTFAGPIYDPLQTRRQFELSVDDYFDFCSQLGVSPPDKKMEFRKEKRRMANLKYYQKNREKFLENEKRYYTENKRKIRERKKEWYKKNKEEKNGKKD